MKSAEYRRFRRGLRHDPADALGGLSAGARRSRFSGVVRFAFSRVHLTISLSNAPLHTPRLPSIGFGVSVAGTSFLSLNRFLMTT